MISIHWLLLLAAVALSGALGWLVCAMMTMSSRADKHMEYLLHGPEEAKRIRKALEDENYEDITKNAN